MTNLAHTAHSMPASAVERARLHQRLIDVMKENGTTPDEIRWPAVEEFQPSTTVAVLDEDEEEREEEASTVTHRRQGERP
jgi:hypothetical protein